MKKPLIFLASSEAIKPGILINSFYDSSQRDSSQDFLLTDNLVGKTCDIARERKMGIISSQDKHFSDENWINEKLSELKDGILISCGWPYLIPNELIQHFASAVNCHGSYLPDYRGSRAYMHYWANCSDFYGATVHYLNEKLDDGNILVRAKLKQFKDESHDDIFIRTAELCGHILYTALLLIEKGDQGYQVTEETARYFYKMTPQEFESHRKMNNERIKKGLQPILTRNKRIQ